MLHLLWSWQTLNQPCPDAFGYCFDYLTLGWFGIVVKSQQIGDFGLLFNYFLNVSDEICHVNSWNSILSFSIIGKFLWNLQSSLHEILLEKDLSLSVKKAWTDYIRFEVGLNAASCEAESFNRFDFLMFRRRFSHGIVFIREADVYFFLFSLCRFRRAFLFRIRFFGRILISFFLVSLLLFLGRAACPGHHVGETNKYFFLREGVYLERGDDKLGFFEVALVEIVDDHIRIEDDFLEELDFLGLSRVAATSMTLRTPSGTEYLLLFGRTVPMMRLGLSGWRC